MGGDRDLFRARGHVFWRRIPEAADERVEAAGAKALCTGDVAPLGPDIIHSVTNPIPRFTCAIHVYGGNFYEQPRSRWDAETFGEAPCCLEDNLVRFEIFGRMAAADAAQ